MSAERKRERGGSPTPHVHSCRYKHKFWFDSASENAQEPMERHRTRLQHVQNRRLASDPDQDVSSLPTPVRPRPRNTETARKLVTFDWDDGLSGFHYSSAKLFSKRTGFEDSCTRQVPRCQQCVRPRSCLNWRKSGVVCRRCLLKPRDCEGFREVRSVLRDPPEELSHTTQLCPVGGVTIPRGSPAGPFETQALNRVWHRWSLAHRST